MTDQAKPIGSDDEAAAAIERIGALDRELAKIETRKSAVVAAASKEAEDRASPIHTERQALVARVEIFCNAERVRLTNGNRSKTATFTTGTCSWRKGKGRVVVDPAQEETILKRLMKLAGFTKTKVSIDVSAVGKSFADDPKTPMKKIPGLSYEPGTEAFSVTPTGAELVERA